MSTASSRGFDIYQSDLARNQLNRDAKDDRRSLYTNTKDDHPDIWATGRPCDCEGGGRDWEHNGAMRVQWPPPPEREPVRRAPEARKSQRKQARGRSR